MTLVVSGQSTDTGQKVHNQLAAFSKLSPDDRLIVFADSDLHLHEMWLAQLVAPVNRGEFPACTGYRWLIPQRTTLPSLLGSIINSSVATQAGFRHFQLLWGGSMAISRKVFDNLDVPGLFQGSLNDDIHLSRALHDAGYPCGVVYSLQMPTPVDYSWHSLAEFI